MKLIQGKAFRFELDTLVNTSFLHSSPSVRIFDKNIAIILTAPDQNNFKNKTYCFVVVHQWFDGTKIEYYVCP